MIEYWYWPNIKTTEICKIFKLSLTAAELEQILYFKSFLWKKQNIDSIILFKWMAIAFFWKMTFC